MRIDESSLNDLRRSAIQAFPHTTKRQHATGPVQISEFRWTPFLGVKTLFVRCEAANEDRRYSPVILFKNVNYGGRGAKVYDTLLERSVSFNKLSLSNTDVLLRCDCADFHWRFQHHNWHDRSLQGPNRKKYESGGGPPANPAESPGMCKHLMKMTQVLREAGYLKR